MSSPRPWLPLPSPIRRLFTAFPLQTFPPAPLPTGSPPPSTVPRLYIHSSSGPDTPSWDAECLKWQTILRLEWAECGFVGSSRHASPSGELPFLVLPTTQEVVPLYKLHQLLLSKFEIPANSRVTAYLNLIDTKIHAAWVYAYYLTEDFDKVTRGLLAIPNGPEPLQYLVRHADRTARRDELERRCMGEIRGDVLYAEADEGYAALSTLLGNDRYFFNERRGGLLDAAVFAYTWTVLDKLGHNDLANIVNKYENLVRHANNFRQLVYPS